MLDKNNILRELRKRAVGPIFSLWLGGKPVPAGRPRVTRWGTYYPKTYTTWLKENEPVVSQMETNVLTGPVELCVEVICPPPKTKTDQVAPMGDVDNYAKGPMDLITKLGKAWKDDRQIVRLTVAKRWAGPGEEPGFAMTWCEIGNGSTREGD
jgi:Holliday junction resolvase RusA-like endonuclease